ncbi:MAG: hypothetical protein FWD66_08845 [Paludibacter sp.]|nr:hypothetical protein [Paludibacter sp.]
MNKNKILSAMLLAAVFFSSSCKKDEPTPSDNSFKIVANVVNGNDYNSMISSVLAFTWVGNPLNDNYEFIAECPYQNGGFSLTLPDTPDSKFLQNLAASLPSSVIVSNPNVNILAISDIEAYDYSNEYLGWFENVKILGGMHYVMKEWIYADGDVTMSGTNSEELHWDFGLIDYLEATFDLTLKKGWNEIYLESDGTYDPDNPNITYSTSNTTNTTVYNDLEWIFQIGVFNLSNLRHFNKFLHK